MMLTGCLATEELAKRANSGKEKAKKKPENRSGQKFGVITIGAGRYHAATRIIAEDREAEAEAARAKRRLGAKERAKEGKSKLNDENQRLKYEAARKSFIKYCG